MKYLFLLFIILFSLNLFAQSECLRPNYVYGTGSFDKVRVGCDQICEEISFQLFNDNCQTSSLTTNNRAWVQNNGRYTIASLTATYTVENSEDITINVPYNYEEPPNSTTGYYKFDANYYDPSIPNGHLYKMNICFDVNIGYNPPVTPPPSYTHIEFDFKYSWQNDNHYLSYDDMEAGVGGYPHYTPNYCNGYLVTGKLSDFLNQTYPPILTNGLHVKGNFEVDVFYNFRGVEFTFDPGAQLLVSSGGNNSSFTNCSFSGCVEMFKGIKLENASVFFDGCLVSDAEIAVDVGPNSYADVATTEFTQNSIGISNFGHVNGFANYYNSGNSTWLPSYQGQVHLPLASKGLCGIRNQPGADLFDAVSRYDNLWNGLESQNAMNRLVSCKFSNIIDVANGNNDKGNGVLLKATNTVLAELTGICTFINCNTGVRDLGQRLNVYNSKMEDVNYGIIVEKVPFNVYIKDNELKVKNLGIQLLGCPGYIKQIKSNKVFLNGTILNNDNSGIYIESSGAPVKVLLNNVQVGIGTYGYRVNNGSQGLIQDNTSFLVQTGQAYKYGFQLSANSSYLICNYSTGETDDRDRFGYDYNLTISRSICNRTLGLRRGFNYNGNNAYAQFSGNDVHAYYGLYVEENATLSNTGSLMHRGNIFRPECLTGAVNRNNWFSISKARFTVDQQENQYFMPTLAGPPDWFYNQSDPNPSYMCNNGCNYPNPLPVPGDNPVCSHAGDIVNALLDLPAYTNYTGERIWTDRFVAYNELITADCTPLHPALQLFKDSLANQEIGQLSGIRQRILGLDVPESMNSSLILTNLSEQQSILLDSLYNIVVDSNNTSNTSNYTLLLSQIENIENAYSIIGSTYLTDLYEKLDDLIEDCESIFVQSSMGSRLKFVYLQLLKSYRYPNYTLNSQDSVQLVQIAALCPGEGGFATLQARGVLGIHHMPYAITDPNCEKANPEIVQPHQKSKKYSSLKSVLIYPNPATQKLVIESDANEEVERIEIFDLMGRSIYEQKEIKQSEQSIDLVGWESGIYLIRITMEDGKEYIRKFDKLP